MAALTFTHSAAVDDVYCGIHSGVVVLALYRYKPQKELGYFLLYLTGADPSGLW